MADNTCDLQTRITVQRGCDCVQFIFISDNVKEAHNAFNEIQYMFNGLNYTSNTIKDHLGNTLAVLNSISECNNTITIDPSLTNNSTINADAAIEHHPDNQCSQTNNANQYMLYFKAMLIIILFEAMCILYMMKNITNI